MREKPLGFGGLTTIAVSTQPQADHVRQVRRPLGNAVTTVTIHESTQVRVEVREVRQVYAARSCFAGSAKR